MAPVGIIEVDRQNEQTLLINFTDGTFASFSAQDLVSLQPKRRIADGEVAAIGQDYLWPSACVQPSSPRGATMHYGWRSCLMSRMA